MRRPKNATSGSLDSLLDTMTNVVGILVILLAVTQLGVGDAVKRIRGLDIDLLDVTPEALELARQNAAELRQTIGQLRQQADQIQDNSLDDLVTLQRLKQLIEELKREQKQTLKTARANRQKLAELIKQRKQKVQELERQVAAADEELARLKGLLDRTPVPPGPPPKLVYLPNPRPAPKGATPVIFVCRQGRIAPLNQDQLRQQAQKAARFAVRLKPDARKTDRPVDCKKLAKHFERRVIGDRYFRLKIRFLSGNPYIFFQRGKDAGETAERLRRPRSRYEQMIRLTDKKKHYARFLVWADSFETYIEARRIAQRNHMAAGWVPYDPSYEYRIPLGIQLQCIGAPPKKRPKPTPKPPTTRPPAPKRPPPPPDEVD